MRGDNIIYIIPIDNLIMYPDMIYPLSIKADHFGSLIEKIKKEKMEIGFFTKHPRQPKQGIEIFETGVLGKILEIEKEDSQHYEIVVKTIKRIKIEKILENEPYLKTRCKSIRQNHKNSVKTLALYRTVKELYRNIFGEKENVSVMDESIFSETDPVKGTDMIISTLDTNIFNKQRILEENNIEKRLEIAVEILNMEKKIINIEEEIQSIVDTEIDKTQREILLREQLRAIKKELGEDEEDVWEEEVDKLKKAVKERGMPEYAEKVAFKEIDRLYEMSPASPEYTVSKTYIDWLLDLPWNVSTKDNLDLKKAQRVLDRDHYNLKEAKERIIEFLAVRHLKKETKGPIICLVGPPGVGKTSLGKSIARALNRKFVRFSIGGIRDEAEIRGHRRTYIGAMPGRIIQLLKEAGTSNPVLMLDEIDKMGYDVMHGDPASALLEALDPEQNNSFTDHYLDVKFDLSQIMFILTANVTYQIPEALLDRLEVIEIPGYIDEEKVKIAKKYLIPRQLKENGLENIKIKFPVKTILGIINNYTDEAGLRELERKIAAILRKIARKVAEGEQEYERTILPESLYKYLGVPREFSFKAGQKDETGVVNGLAWTSAGGEMLIVEVMIMPGSKQLTLTGQLGDVMQESAQAALTYIRSYAKELGLPPDFYNEIDIHIHLPEGAVPKDGPSAGITLATGLISALTDIPVNHKIAMTGEVSLRGKVLPVGAIKEKVIAAYRADISTVILPRANEKELSEVPESIKKKLKFIPVDNLQQVLETALVKNPFLKENHSTDTRLYSILNLSEKK